MKSCQNASLCNSFGRKKRKKQCPLICLKCFILCHQGQQPCLHLQQAWKSDHTKLLWLRKTQKDYSVLHICLLKTCSCTTVRYFRFLFWNDITIIWDENIVYFLHEKKKLFWTNKKFGYSIFINKLLWHHPKITYKNIVQKDMNKIKID